MKQAQRRTGWVGACLSSAVPCTSLIQPGQCPQELFSGLSWSWHLTIDNICLVLLSHNLKHSVQQSWVCTWIRWVKPYPLLLSSPKSRGAEQAGPPSEISPVCQSYSEQQSSRRAGKPTRGLPAS